MDVNIDSLTDAPPSAPCPQAGGSKTGLDAPITTGPEARAPGSADNGFYDMLDVVYPDIRTTIDFAPDPENTDEDPGILGYLEKSFNQLVKGNYTDDVTLLGTAAQIGTGVLGVDLPGDIRDITHDLTHWEWSWGHAGQTLLDTVGVLPVIGSLKYADDAGTLIKSGAKHLDETATLANKVDDVVEDTLAGARRGIDDGIDDAAELTAKGAADVDGGVIATEFTGKFKGKPVTLTDIEVRRIEYTRRSRESLDELRNQFDSGVRQDFLKSMGNDPDKVEVLKAAGLTDAQIAKIASGNVPKGYNVHHKIPLDDGGTNDIDNLVLIRNNTEHYTLTNAQRDLTGDIPYGDTMTIDFPIPPGFIYPRTGL